MKRRLALLIAVAIVALMAGVGSAAHAAENEVIPAGTYSVALPGGGTLGFTVDSAGNVTITVVPDGATAGTPTLQGDGFTLVLTNGTATSLVEVQAENEDGQLTVKAEQETDNTETEHSGEDISGEGQRDGAAEPEDVSSPVPQPQPTETATSSGDDHADVSGDASPSPGDTSGSDGGNDG